MIYLIRMYSEVSDLRIQGKLYSSIDLHHNRATEQVSIMKVMQLCGAVTYYIVMIYVEKALFLGAALIVVITNLVS